MVKHVLKQRKLICYILNGNIFLLPFLKKDACRFPFPWHAGLCFVLDLKTSVVHHHSIQNLLLNSATVCLLVPDSVLEIKTPKKTLDQHYYIS